MARPLSGEIYFEHRKVRNVIRVAAICGVTGLEVVIVGPSSASQKQLENVALQKLRHRADKLAEERGGNPVKGLIV